MTSQRATVMAALSDAGPHPTAERVAERAQLHDPGLHLATVYRTLNVLEEHGLVSHVHLGHGPAVYHLANERHAHAVCSGCAAQVEVDADLLAPLAEALRQRWAFVLDPHHFALGGWCRTCAERHAAVEGGTAGVVHPS
jgi:Fur family ferric uptake transcriptional regulator